MRYSALIILAALIAAGWFYTRSNNVQNMQTMEIGQSKPISVIIPEFTAAARTGETYFNAKCAACHGKNAAGTENGPPFLHRFYRPAHHGDEAFQRAPKLGVQAHHWNFGNMPPVQGITRAEISKIITYVRELQVANGIK
ncbi:MAG: cytochrome c [Rhodobacterales bacterium]